MTSLIAYQKHIDATYTRELRLPALPDGTSAGQELCTLPDGRTVVALAEGVELPKDQPAEIAASIHPVAADDAATLEAVKAASPHVRLIHQRMQDQIRAMYSPEDEMYFARIGTGAALGMYTMSEKEKQAITVYSEHVEAVRQWGRSERAKLGL